MYKSLKYFFEFSEREGQKYWWSQIHLIALTGLLIRVIVVFVSDNIYHPDEIFQYLEQAHRLKFGYGIIPWEYRYGIRSWILPGFLAGILHILHNIGIDEPKFYIPIIRSFFCFSSLSLIYSAYIITRSIASENAGRLASLLTCFWYELIYFASKPTPEVLSAYSLSLAVACICVKPNRRNALLFGFLSALSIVLRLQYLPVILPLMVIGTLRLGRTNFLTTSIAFLIPIVVAGYIDYLTWGGFLGSYYNNYIYNSIYKVSEIFGTSPHNYYVKSLMISSGGIFVFATFGCLMTSNFSKIWLPLLCIVSIVLPHSLIAHKEHRFIFASTSFLIILTTIFISDFIAKLGLTRKLRSLVEYLFIAAILIFCLSAFGFTSRLPSYQTLIPYKDRIYHVSLLARHPMLSAYLFLHEEPSLVAILNQYSIWWMTGGYYYLHRNVPIYYPDHLEGISIENYSSYISHIICRKSDDLIPGFAPVFELGNLEIRKAIKTPSHNNLIDIDTINIPQLGVDDVFQPTVKVPSRLKNNSEY